jgi:hypothetical protein
MSSPLLSLSSSVGVTLFLFLSYISSINLNISHLFFFQNLILYCCLCIQVLILYYFSFINVIISCELYLHSYSCLHVFMFACCMQQVTKGCNCIHLYYLMNLIIWIWIWIDCSHNMLPTAVIRSRLSPIANC